jgi:hypothetical protein
MPSLAMLTSRNVVDVRADRNHRAVDELAQHVRALRRRYPGDGNTAVEVGLRALRGLESAVLGTAAVEALASLVESPSAAELAGTTDELLSVAGTARTKRHESALAPCGQPHDGAVATCGQIRIGRSREDRENRRTNDTSGVKDRAHLFSPCTFRKLPIGVSAAVYL